MDIKIVIKAIFNRLVQSIIAININECVTMIDWYQLVGGWPTPLKIWVRQWEGWHPRYEMDNKSNVWNHQPDIGYMGYYPMIHTWTFVCWDSPHWVGFGGSAGVAKTWWLTCMPTARIVISQIYGDGLQYFHNTSGYEWLNYNKSKGHFEIFWALLFVHAPGSKLHLNTAPRS
jgi:hypothetical protein